MAKIRFKSTIHSEQINECTVQARIYGPKPFGMVGPDQDRKIGKAWTGPDDDKKKENSGPIRTDWSNIDASPKLDRLIVIVC